MLHLTHGNRTEALLDALAADLSRARGETVLERLRPLALVVPNPNVETYVRLGLARRTGIAANLDTFLLQRFLGGVLERTLPGAALLQGEVLQGLVLAALLDERRLADPELAPVRAWLQAAGDAPDAVDRRRVQLAAQLAHLYEEYGYQRPELFATWPRRPLLDGTPFAEAERWQRRLWLSLAGPDGLAQALGARRGLRFLSLPAALDELDAARLRLPPQVHLFGISYVASAFQRVIARLARETELHVYTLNPCLEFWEDVPSGREIVRRDRLPRRGARLPPEALLDADPFGLEVAGDPPALVLWGRPGRENVRLLNELGEGDFRALPVDPGDATLLARLQRDILLREPERREPPAMTPPPPDGSITFLACAGVRRECEAIAREIWRLLQEDEARPREEGEEPLRFHDVAVVVAGPERELYFTHLAAAFREAHGLPFSLADLPLAHGSRVAEAVRLLLELPHGRAGRAEVLRLVTHPNVAAAVPDADPADWVRWTARAGVFHGADRDAHAGTYVEGDALSWDQGLRRLALGAFQAGDRSGEGRAFTLGDDRYLPLELAPSEADAAAAFGLLVRGLLADARFVREARLPLAEWSRLLATLVRVHVHANEEERRELDRCLGALHGLAALDAAGGAVSSRVACELALGAIDRLSGGRGAYLAGGVVVAGLQPMRAIPFRAIFVAGLGEGRFPASDRRSPLDLRGARPRPGDVGPREGDRYLFLETLLSARERLYLSWVARDEKTGEPLAPSSVVLELGRMLERGYLGDGAVERDLTRRQPLRRFDEPLERRAEGLDPAPPAAHGEAKARALRASLLEAIGEDRRLELAALLPRLPADGAHRVRALVGAVEARPPPAPRADEGVMRVSLADLRRFLECPMQGAARAVLRLPEDEDDDARDREDEPFDAARSVETVLLREVFVEAGREPEAVYDARVERRRAAGDLPVGLFGARARRRHLGVLHGWASALAGAEAELPLRRVRFGPAAEGDRADELHGPLRLEVPRADGSPRVVELIGALEPQLAGPSVSVTLRVGRSRESRTTAPRDALRGFVDGVVKAAAGLAPDGHEAWLVSGEEGAGLVVRTRFSSLAPEAARAWLSQQLAALLDETHDRFAPCELVFELEAAGPQSDAAELAARLIEQGRHSSRFGPVPRPESRPLPDAAALARLRTERFGLFFALRRGEGA